ncbi:MAG: SDR family oxidoreductase [Halieaceae bacterium]|nr:SDR family oxidoreductase [Halieaceae bacterium]
MTRKLSGRTALITGAARGLGVNIAERLGSDGANIMLVDINEEGLSEAAEQVAAAGAPQVGCCVHDLGVESGANSAVEKTRTELGGLDILVNNAGGGIIRPFLEHTVDTLQETLKRNLWTTIHCTRAVLPHMMEQQYGRIVNIGADSVHTGIWSHAGYNAAKGGINGLTTGLAFEFAEHHITVNAVSPGGVLTPEVAQMFDPNSEVYKKHQIVDVSKALERIPIGRFVEMHEVSAMVAFLTHEDSLGITGQIYSVNGGQWMM